jgi:hypothetical protein
MQILFDLWNEIRTSRQRSLPSNHTPQLSAPTSAAETSCLIASQQMLELHVDGRISSALKTLTTDKQKSTRI